MLLEFLPQIKVISLVDNDDDNMIFKSYSAVVASFAYWKLEQQQLVCNALNHMNRDIIILLQSRRDSSGRMATAWQTAELSLFSRHC
jgi:hypothetical protein